MGNYERERLYALRQLNLLDTQPSDSFDRIARMASQLFDLPIAAVSLTDEDRQWFKSRVGVDHWEIPRQKACCGEVSDTCDVVVVPDLLESDCYRDSVLAESGIRFYAGAPLITHDGYTLGAMCVLGHERRTVTETEIATLRDLASMVMAQIELQHAVGRIDPVTGLANYNQFVEDLEDLALDHPGQTTLILSAELIDFSQSSSLQRVMGPAYLEELSRAAGQTLQQTLGADTKLYHIGPCQFAHLRHGTDEEAMTHARSLREELASLTLDGGAPFMLRPVVGVAPFRLGHTTPSDVVRIAHSAARDARQAEQSAGLYSAASDASHQRRFNLIRRFGEALDRQDQLHLVYQPKIDMDTGRCLGAEALIRWRDPDLGDISPAEFIPLVENTAMARALTDWVMRNAIHRASLWHRTNPGMRVSINIAASNLEEEDFIERALMYLAQEQVPVSAIELELTEGGLISNGQAARNQLNALVATGFQIAIDDFGTGYSSLTYLQAIPAHVVKIDRSFIDDLENQPRNQTLVRSMINMAHDLGYSVVSEGVETWETYRLLQNLGCDKAQGFLFARPLAPRDFEHWLADFNERGQ